MKRFHVVFTRDGRRDFVREVKRWRLNHSKNTYLLEDEVAAALKVLSATARYGEEAADVRLPGVRRVARPKLSVVRK